MTDEQREAFDRDARVLFRGLAYASGFRAAKDEALKIVQSEMWAKEDGSIHSAESRISWMEPENGGDRCQAALREMAYIAGFQAAKEAAIKAIEDTPCVYPRDTRECQLGDAEATKYAAIDNVSKLRPNL